MGIFSDFLNTTVVLDDDRPIVALDRVAHMELTRLAAKCDPDHPTAFAQRVEVQTVVPFVNEITSGNYTLTLTLKSGETFTTANIAHNSNAATVETAIDVAATAAAIVGWTNGDISVSGGPLTTTAVVLTFDGTSVANQKHPTATIADVDLVADTVGAVTTTVNGVVAVDEVQEIAIYDSTVTAGNFTLTFLLADTTTFTTANIVYDAAAGVIETAIDVAATGNVTGWTNGDITVAGGNLTANPVTLTFDGASVNGADHSLTVISSVDLAATTINTVTTTANGVAPVDEIQTVDYFANEVVSGNYTLNFTLADATNFITGNIAFDADAATIEAAIDTAANGTVVGWTDGDISVAGGGLNTANVTLTFDGASVAGANHAATVIADVDLVVDTPGDVTTIANGVVAVDEVQMLSVFTGYVGVGNYTLEFTIGATNFTTGNLVYDSDAAAIETAIDAAATGAGVPAWVNCDISAVGGPLSLNPVTLSFTGASVAGGDHALVIIHDVTLRGGDVGPASTITDGEAAEDEVQEIGTYNGIVDGGTFTLTVLLENAETFTTANIAYNANAATIETAIDTAANGTVTGWTDGDISVSGGDLTANAVTLTFDGASVNEANHALTTMDDANLTGGGTGGVIATPTDGHPDVAEEQQIAVFLGTVTSGNFSLTITLDGLAPFTTANVAYNAAAATIETAIDVAATTAVVPAWTNGDISVSGGPLTTGAVTLLFDGVSVIGANHALTVIANEDLDGVYGLGTVHEVVKGVVPVDEEQGIAVFDGTVTSGNYTLEFTLADLTNFTTANIAYNADAATIETAIDVAATGVAVPGWVNGDITVSNGPLTTNVVNILFDGASVNAANHAAIIIADVDLVADTLGVVTQTQNGVVQVDEEQEVGDFLNPIASGNYTLEFTLAGPHNFTTANIPFDATNTVIEAAIDTAANGVVPGWTDGDISVTGGPLDAAAVTLLFDGASVAGANHDLTVIADVDLVPDYFGAVTETTPGVAPVNEEQEVAIFDGTVTSGNYTLQITLNAVAPFTTANIAYNATAAAIETAINVAATAAAVPGWTNGDISISGAPLTTVDVAVVFDGASVAGDNHAITVIADVDLVAENVDDPIVTINGQTNRTPWAILSAMGLVMGVPPVQGVAPVGLVAASNPNTNANWPRPSTIQAVAEQAAIDDDNIEVFNEIMSLFNIQPHTPR